MSEVQIQSRWSKDMVLSGLVPLGGSRGKPVALPFPLSRGHLHPLAHGSSLHLQCRQHSIFIFYLFLPNNSFVISSLPLTLWPLSYKDPCDYFIRHTWKILVNLPISRFLITALNSFFSIKVKYSQVLVIRMWTFVFFVFGGGGDIFSPP